MSATELLLKTYEVTFGVRGSQNKWTAKYRAQDFTDAYEKALETLAQNEDTHSYIIKIEIW